MSFGDVLNLQLREFHAIGKELLNQGALRFDGALLLNDQKRSAAKCEQQQEYEALFP
jgi:hypothetical protein